MDYEFKRKGAVMDNLLDYLEEFRESPMSKIDLPDRLFGGVIKSEDTPCVFNGQPTFWLTIPGEDMTLDHFQNLQLNRGHFYVITSEDGENFELNDLGKVEYYVRDLASTPAEELIRLTEEGHTIEGRHTATFGGFTWDIRGIIQTSIAENAAYKYYSFTLACRVAHYTDLSVGQVLYQRELLVNQASGELVQDQLVEIPLYI